MTEHARIKILLVDDEETFLETLSERLKARGLRVTTARSGKEALRKAEKQEFEVIVVDLSMPVMDGLETTRALKQLNPPPEVIVLTGHGSIKSGVQSIKEGAFDFLQKPIEINSLVNKISEACAHYQKTREALSRDQVGSIARNHSW